MQGSTIAAIATAPGAGGIAVVRLSGAQSYAVAERVFRPANPGKKVAHAFLGQLACAYKAFRAENAKKFFYNLPLITVSYTGLILTLILGGLCMAIPDVPNWLGAIVGAVVLAFTALAVIKASVAADIVESVDKNVAEKTAFLRKATADAEVILASAKSAEVKAECKKVYEALRYSDPMSNEALSVTEAKITVKLDELKSAVTADDAEKTKTAAEELMLLIKERNAKCKALK